MVFMQYVAKGVLFTDLYIVDLRNYLRSIKWLYSKYSHFMKNQN